MGRNASRCDFKAPSVILVQIGKKIKKKTSKFQRPIVENGTIKRD